MYNLDKDFDKNGGLKGSKYFAMHMHLFHQQPSQSKWTCNANMRKVVYNEDKDNFKIIENEVGNSPDWKIEKHSSSYMLCHYLSKDEEIPDFSLLDLCLDNLCPSKDKKYKNYICYLETRSEKVFIGFTIKFRFMYNKQKENMGKKFSPDGLLEIFQKDFFSAIDKRLLKRKLMKNISINVLCLDFYHLRSKHFSI